jgi:meso-butanediol dehydrogenase / (S,S)-butanediol dehydrogenase / diacetyl reductase
VIRTDIGLPADIDAAVRFAIDRYGRIDFLHNNAFAPWRGEDGFSLTADVGDAHWDHVINLGLTSAFRFTRAVVPIMQRQGGGAIVNTASTAGFHPEARTTAYGVAKAGVIQLSRATAIEYAKDGIRCNAICPGVIRTPLTEGAPLDADFMRGIPLGRLGTPEEMANAILFLASDLATYITGATLVADGGRTV